MAYTTIDDPSEYFQTALYTGNATQRNITNDGNSDLQPDWVWIKCRSAVESHMLYDSTRGVTKDLRTDGTNAENTNAQGLQTFNSDGFQIGTLQNVNFNTKTMVAWQWKANGGTTSSNTDGSITSTVQANTTAGFSIVTFTGTSSNQTVGHGLNQAPEIFFVKSRASGSTNWNTYTSVIDGSLDFLFLNESNAAGNASNSLPTSSVIYQNNTDSSVAYCFHSVKGYSKIGKYTGNGNADGPFVYTGFKPAFLLVKNASATQGWNIVDTKRDTFNETVKYLTPSNSGAEDTSGDYYGVDLLSNGFKARDTDAFINGSGNTMIYMAFAEHPFVSSKGVPTTAR
jgi:hypothetical protein